MIDDQKRFAKMGALVVNQESKVVAIVSTILQSLGMSHIKRALNGNKTLAVSTNTLFSFISWFATGPCRA